MVWADLLRNEDRHKVVYENEFGFILYPLFSSVRLSTQIVLPYNILQGVKFAQCKGATW